MNWKLFILELATLLPPTIANNASNLNARKCTSLNMVLQSYGFSLNSDEECTEINDDLNNRKSVNYSDNMIAMSPFAGDYPPATTNYINYTDLDANYAAPGKRKTSFFSPLYSHFRPRSLFALWVHLLPFLRPTMCIIVHSRYVDAFFVWVMKFNMNSMSPEVTNSRTCLFCCYYHV